MTCWNLHSSPDTSIFDRHPPERCWGGKFGRACCPAQMRAVEVVVVCMSIGGERMPCQPCGIISPSPGIRRPISWVGVQCCDGVQANAGQSFGACEMIDRLQRRMSARGVAVWLRSELRLTLALSRRVPLLQSSPPETRLAKLCPRRTWQPPSPPSTG